MHPKSNDRRRPGARSSGGCPVLIVPASGAPWLLAVAGLWGAHVAGALAQQPAAPPMATPVTPVFAIKGFTITGENPLGDGETSRVLAPFLRTDATIDVLQKATAALEAALRVKGFGLHRVALPPQEVGDTVKLSIVKFSIGKVTIEGATRFDAANVRASLPELKEGSTPNFRRLAVQTTIANESPAKQTSVSLRESDEPDKIDATVQVRESRPWTLGLSASNAGAPSSGRDRVTISGGHSNLWNLDHQFVGAYTTSAEATSAVRQLGLSYRAPLYALGGVVGASYTRSDVIGDFGAFTSTGAGSTFGINYTHYLPPDGGYRAYVTIGLDDKLFRATVINGTAIGVDRRSKPVTLSYAARVESDAALWGYNLDLAVNTGWGRANDLVSHRTEDPRVDTLDWYLLRTGFNYTANFGGNWIWSTRWQGQYSPYALISGEQFGVGGPSSIRGTPNRLSGDSGYSAVLEITTPEITSGLRALGFMDAGWVYSHQPNGTTKLASDRMASIGLGLRYSHPSGVAFTADYGRLIRGSAIPLAVNSGAPQRGEDKLHLNLSVRF